MTKRSPAPSASDRSRGRPAGPDAGDLQAHLLDVAEQRFADEGYAATSVRALAEEAGVNPALVHYYFGSKRKLLIAVMDRALEPLAEAVAELKGRDQLHLDHVTGLLFRALHAHPSLPRLVVREVLLSGGEFREHFVRQYAPRLGGAIEPLVRELQRQGRIDPDFDPPVVVVLIMSLCMFPFVARPLAEPVLGLRYDSEGLERLLVQVNRLLLAGVEP